MSARRLASPVSSSVRARVRAVFRSRTACTVNAERSTDAAMQPRAHHRARVGLPVPETSTSRLTALHARGTTTTRHPVRTDDHATDRAWRTGLSWAPSAARATATRKTVSTGAPDS
jgi:hypothetical protein